MATADSDSSLGGWLGLSHDFSAQELLPAGGAGPASRSHLWDVRVLGEEPSGVMLLSLSGQGSQEGLAGFFSLVPQSFQIHLLMRGCMRS